MVETLKLILSRSLDGDILELSHLVKNQFLDERICDGESIECLLHFCLTKKSDRFTGKISI